jgi:hypothetical protein
MKLSVTSHETIKCHRCSRLTWTTENTNVRPPSVNKDKSGLVGIVLVHQDSVKVQIRLEYYQGVDILQDVW